MSGRALEDTIAAIATPEGRSAVGIVRLSGPEAWPLAARFLRSPQPLRPRQARYGAFHAAEGRVIDRVVATAFKGPASYTGEDVVELSAHGNPVILKAILGELLRGGARLARPGEFTLRAVRNGKLDLAQAEAVRDFIEAQTDSQARTAMAQMDGAAAKQARPMREEMVALIAAVEAGIDFADDGVPPADADALRPRIEALHQAVRRQISTSEHRRLVSEGLRLAIAGRPNVGKSSIFNCLCGDGRAIVTSAPGTTRDVLTETVEIGGVPVRVADTAGIRPAAEEVEAIGIERAIEAMADADFILVVLDLSRELEEEDRRILVRVADRPHLAVLNKLDLPPKWDGVPGHAVVRTNARTGEGLDALRAAIAGYIHERRPANAEDAFAANLRQRQALAAIEERLSDALEALETGTPHEMLLVDLYAALAALGELTGEVATDDILDAIFSRFCIGK